MNNRSLFGIVLLLITPLVFGNPLSFAYDCDGCTGGGDGGAGILLFITFIALAFGWLGGRGWAMLIYVPTLVGILPVVLLIGGISDIWPWGYSFKKFLLVAFLGYIVGWLIIWWFKAKEKQDKNVSYPPQKLPIASNKRSDVSRPQNIHHAPLETEIKVVQSNEKSTTILCPECSEKIKVETGQTQTYVCHKCSHVFKVYLGPQPVTEPEEIEKNERQDTTLPGKKWSLDSKTKMLTNNVSGMKYPPVRYKYQDSGMVRGYQILHGPDVWVNDWDVDTV